MSDLEVIHRPGAVQRVDASDFMPVLSVEKAVERKQMMNQFINQVLKEGDDYGKMPGDTRTDAKKVLFKPGAEKLCSIFGMAPQYLEDKIIEDWTGAEHGGEPLFYYSYRCQLMRGDRFMGEAIGSANSWEVKYRYRWVSQEVADADGRFEVEALVKRGGRQLKFEPDFAIAKRETTGQYGKPAEYWDKFTAAAGAKRVEGRQLGKKSYSGWEVSIDSVQYRIPNPDVADVINTLQKMAQKRALVAAVLVVTNCSDAFTQDLEDATQSDLPLEAESGPRTAPPAEELPAKLPEELEGLFGPDAPVKGTSTAFEICRREMMEAFGADKGVDEYRKILALNGIKEKGNSNANIRAALIQCWTTAKKLKALNGWKDPHAPATEPRDGAGTTAADDWGAGRE